MTIETYFITGFAFGFEFSPDPDFGGTCLVIDIGIIRFIITKENDDA